MTEGQWKERTGSTGARTATNGVPSGVETLHESGISYAMIMVAYKKKKTIIYMQIKHEYDIVVGYGYRDVV